MANAKSESEFPGPEAIVRPDLEADIKQLREDVARLREEISKLGRDSYGTARRAASEGVEELRARGEAAMQGLRDNAREVEDQLMTTVREKPITSLAVAAAVGYFFALLSRR